MTREIKFRAWDVLGELYINWMELRQTIMNRGDCRLLWDTMTGRNETILEQYTGLKDKNGVEIYESDLISISDPRIGKAIGAARVVFSYGYVGGWVCTADDKSFLTLGTRTQDLEIIGNIHQHPELLE